VIKVYVAQCFELPNTKIICVSDKGSKLGFYPIFRGFIHPSLYNCTRWPFIVHKQSEAISNQPSHYLKISRFYVQNCIFERVSNIFGAFVHEGLYNCTHKPFIVYKQSAAISNQPIHYLKISRFYVQN
jgi:hypothetical protein